MGAPMEDFNGGSPSADISTDENAIKRFASCFSDNSAIHKVMQILTAAAVVKEVDLTSPAVWTHAALMFEVEYRVKLVMEDAEDYGFDFPHIAMVEKASIIQNAFVLVYTWLESQIPIPWDRSVGWSVCHWLLANYLEHHSDEDFLLSQQSGLCAGVRRLNAFRMAVKENPVANACALRDSYQLIVSGDRFTLSGRLPPSDRPVIN